MIQKKIHYCWFGNKPKPKHVIDCIYSWHKYLSDYEIIEWNEQNFPLNHPFVINAIRFKLWAFVSDFARISILKKYGGIYLDTDMLFVKPLPLHFLELESFVGTEDNYHLSAGIIGTTKDSRFINDLYFYYNSLGYVANYHDYIIPQIITKKNFKINSEITEISRFNELTVFLPEYFYPLPYKLRNESWKSFITPNTICVHLWSGSWLKKQEFTKLEKIRNFSIKQFGRLVRKIFTLLKLR